MAPFSLAVEESDAMNLHVWPVSLRLQCGESLAGQFPEAPCGYRLIRHISVPLH